MMEYQQQYKKYADSLEHYLQQNAKSCFAPQCVVGEAAMYSLMAGGKRMRGVLCLAICDMLSGNMYAAYSFACACEMVHSYSLIHDDLPCMDNDDMRRGKPSCHKAYGEANALLAGDALLTAAFEIIAVGSATDEQKAAAVLALSRAAGAKGMIYGQELDISSEGRIIAQTELELIHKNKTGMMINAAATLGGLSANANAKQHKALSEFAFTLGLCFQIRDDILDVTASEAELGKPIGSDKSNNKNTFVTLNGLDASYAYVNELTDKAKNILKNEFDCNVEFLTELAHSMANRKN